MIDTMAPPQGPHQHTKDPAGGPSPILIVQQRALTSPLLSTNANSSSEASSSSSSSTSSTSSSSSTTNSQSSLNPQINLQQASATSPKVQEESVNEDTNEDAIRNKLHTDQEVKSTEVTVSSSSSTNKTRVIAETQPGINTSQDNSSSQSETLSAAIQSAPAISATSSNQSKPSPASNYPHNQQHHYHNNQSVNYNGKYNPYNQSQSIHTQAAKVQATTSARTTSTTSTNNTSFSATRSSNQRGHNNSHRNNYKSNINHHYHQGQQHYNHQHQQAHNHHNQSQQMRPLTNGASRVESRQQSYNSVVASSLPPTSSQSSDVVARNTSSSINRRSTAPTVTGPPHYVDMHVYAGECVAFQLLDGQEQIITGPATITMVSHQESPPVPIPVQVPPGHMIHQVADENGTLKHIIFSVMNCENIDSNVINFSNETFRVDSFGELANAGNSSISYDANSTNIDHRSAVLSSASKSNSNPSDKIDEVKIDSSTHHQDNIDPNQSSEASATSYRENLASSTNKLTASESNYEKQTSSECEKSQVAEIKNGQQQIENSAKVPFVHNNPYDISVKSQPELFSVAHPELQIDVDPSLGVPAVGQMMNSVDGQMYGYPTACCCCCYCDPNAEAIVANGNQPTGQISANSMLGQQQPDVILMAPIQAQQSLQQDSMSSTEQNLVDGMSMGFHSQTGTLSSEPAASIAISTGSHQDFQNHPHINDHHPMDTSSNIPTKTHRGQKGSHLYNKQGAKTQQSTYDKHRNNYQGGNHHYNNQAAYSSSTSGGKSQNCHQENVSMVSYKSSQSQMSGTQSYQSIYPNIEDQCHSTNYDSVSNLVPTCNLGTSTPSSQQSIQGHNYRGNHGHYNAAGHRGYRNDHQQQSTDMANFNSELASIGKRHLYPLNDKGNTVRYGSSTRTLNNANNNNHLGSNHSASSGSVSPMRSNRNNKSNIQHQQASHNQYYQNHQQNGLRSAHMHYYPPPLNQASQEHTGKDIEATSWNARQNSAMKSTYTNSIASTRHPRSAHKQQPIVSNETAKVQNEDISKTMSASSKSNHKMESNKNSEATSNQARNQLNSTSKRTGSASMNEETGSTITRNDDTPSKLSRSSKTISNIHETEHAINPNEQQDQKLNRYNMNDGLKQNSENIVSQTVTARNSRGKQKKNRKDDDTKAKYQHLSESITPTSESSSSPNAIKDDNHPIVFQKKSLKRETQKASFVKNSTIDTHDDTLHNPHRLVVSPNRAKKNQSKSNPNHVESGQISTSDSSSSHNHIDASKQSELGDTSVIVNEKPNNIHERQHDSTTSDVADQCILPVQAIDIKPPSPVGKDTTISSTHNTVKANPLNEIKNDVIKQHLVSDDSHDDILIVESVANAEAHSDKPTFSISLRSSFSENNIRALENTANMAKSTQTTPQKESSTSQDKSNELDNVKTSSVDPALIDNQTSYDLNSRPMGSKKKISNSGINKLAQQVRLNSLPQVRMLNLVCASITPYSVCLKWSYIPNIADKYGVSNHHPNHGKNGTHTMDHFVIESSGGKSVESNTLISSKIVFQGCSMTCRINHLMPEKIYHFRVRRTALISSNDIEHLAVSGILSVTLPSVQQQTGITQLSNKQKGNQQHVVNEVGANSTPNRSSASSHQASSNSVKHQHHHNQPVRVISILKQCRHKLVANMGKAVQNSLSSCSDTKFAGLLLLVFTMFATLLAILIDYYIVTE